jgi:hypothetical protein
MKLAIYAKAPDGDLVIEEFLDDADVFIDEPQELDIKRNISCSKCRSTKR